MLEVPFSRNEKSTATGKLTHVEIDTISIHNDLINLIGEAEIDSKYIVMN